MIDKKPIELERESEWSDLRRKVYEQPIGVTKMYHIGGGRTKDAAQAVRNVARKYKFKVSVKIVQRKGMLYVMRGQSQESEPTNDNP